MRKIIERYFKVDFIENIIKVNKFNDEATEIFINELEKTLSELKSDNALNDKSDFDFCINSSTKYANDFSEKVKEGFSAIWSKTYAEYTSFDEVRNLLPYCFEESSKVSSEIGLKDLKLYCNLKYDDQLIKDYLIRMGTTSDLYSLNGVENTALDFSKYYREKIEKGMSDIYAFQYADLMAEDYYHKIYCEEYAFAYEKAIINGKDKEYATTYAAKYGSELVDIKRRAFIYDDEEMLDFARKKAEAYINAWEYIRDNKLSNIKTFYADYERAYLNAMHPDDPSEWKTVEECEKVAEQKAMKEYNKRKSE